jgi:hypothetical protein
MQTRARFDHFARGLHSGAVPGDARQMSPASPAPIAVHDDGDMAGQALEIQSFEQRRFFATGRFQQIA